MKQFKKFLCSAMLTSFVIIGSVSVFAAVPPANDGGKEGDFTDCAYKEARASTEQEASSYTETQTHLGTLSGEMGGGDSGGDNCQHQQIVESLSTETAENHREVVNADMQLNVGHIWGDDVGDEIKYLL